MLIAKPEGNFTPEEEKEIKTRNRSSQMNK